MRDGADRKSWSQDWLWVIYIFLAAVMLYTANLGDLPLRDWDEGIVAGVARNIWRSEPGSHTWLYPTINYGDPYWNKPPLIHWLIALSYKLFGVSEGTTRLVPALLSASSVPLLYLIARELFSLSTATGSSLVYLTLLPIARHGRVAMLDGAITCWFCFGVWCLLRGKKHHSWLLGVGIALGLICLTKGIMMGVLLGGIIFIFTVWDHPKLLSSYYLWGGILLGIAPAIAWYLLQYWHYGEQFLGINLGTQTFKRIWSPISNVSAPPWYYLLEILKYSLPWLIFLPRGVKLAWSNRHLSWGKLTLVWGGIYLLAISLMQTKLPWYVIPLYPALSLIVGSSLEEIRQRKTPIYFEQISLSLVALLCWLASAYYSFTTATDLAVILLVVAISLTIASILLWYRHRHFILTISLGFYLALLLLFNSTHWLWELNDAFPVQPVAQMLQQHVPPQEKIYTNYPLIRPSLEFYSDRVVLPRSNKQLQELQQTQSIYLLINADTRSQLNLESSKIIDQVRISPALKSQDFSDYNGTWQLVILNPV